MRVPLLGCFLVALALPSAAQDVPVGSCETGTARAVLETETLLIPVGHGGSLFLDQSVPHNSADRLRYLVPKAEGVSPVFLADLLLSGFVGDSLRTAGLPYGPSDLWPGPLDDADAPPADCTAFDRVWVVSRADIVRYVETGEATADLAEWPAALGAPVLDGDGVSGNYDLAAGDQPDLVGDVAAWWVQNDAGNDHGYPRGDKTAPLGVEVRTLAYAFEGSPFLAVPAGPLQEASFFRFEVVNRRDVPIDSLRLSLYVDADLGGRNDDYVGVDTLRHLVYTYNGDSYDEDNGSSEPGYGPAPPAWGVQFLRGPVAMANGRDDDDDGTVDEPDERARLTTSPLVEDDYGTGIPSSPLEVYHVQRGLTTRGDTMYAFGLSYPCRGLTGCEEAPPTVFGLSGDPARRAFWSEPNFDGTGRSLSPGDRPSIATTGPARLAPGERAVVDVAFPYARGASHLESVTVLRTVAGGLLSVFGDGFPPRRVLPPPPPPPPANRSLTVVRPNPGAGGQAAVLALPEPAHVSAVVFDALGRRVAVVADGPVEAGERVLAIPDGLPPGAYQLRVAADRGRPVAVPFVVVR